MAGWLENRVAVVTGGGSGIGRAAALSMAVQGAGVAVADTDARGAEQTVDMIRRSGGRAEFFHCDVTSEAGVADMIGGVVDSLGGLDCAFNNAGVGGAASTIDCTEDEWNMVLGVNLKGVWLCMKHELRHMAAQGRGAIVNMSSVAGLVGTVNRPAYTASKHGVLGLTKVAALEHAEAGIRVNAVCPGSVKTPLIETMLTNADYRRTVLERHPMNRLAMPEEIAEAVVWLCSDQASFITGAALPVDGGCVVP